MNAFTRSVSNVVTGGAKAIVRYPVSMASALVLAVTASIRVADSLGSQPVLYDSLQIAAFLGTFLGIAATAFTVIFFHRRRFFVFAQVVAMLIAAGTFLVLYLPDEPLPDIVVARVMAASGIALLLFLLLLSHRGSGLTYSDMSFVTIRSAAIAILYTLVLLGGLNFLVFTIKFLIYDGLSNDVYAHVSIWSALVGYAFFLGYFPDFRRTLPMTESQAAVARKHPLFFEVLMAYVVIPIIAAISVVLLIWSARILVLGQWPEFGQLALIFSSYALVGTVVAVLTGSYRQLSAIWFRRVFPFAALLFLAFETYAIVDQMQRTGLQTSTYAVIMITLYAAVSSVLLLLRPVTRDRWTGWVAVAVIALSVLPFTGYVDMPALVQSARLEQVLIRNDMLVDGRIRPVTGELPESDRVLISETAEHLTYSDSSLVPNWFTQSYPNDARFADVFGFEIQQPYPPFEPQPQTYITLALPEGAVSLDRYDFAISFSEYQSVDTVTFEGMRGEYSVSVQGRYQDQSPRITLTIDGQTQRVVELRDWLEALASRYGREEQPKPNDIPYRDLVFETEQDGIRLMLVMTRIEIIYEEDGSRPSFYIMPNALYLGE